MLPRVQLAEKSQQFTGDHINQAFMIELLYRNIAGGNK